MFSHLNAPQFTAFIALLATLLVTGKALGLTVEGVTLPDSANVGGQDLVLNGAGVREATMFKVKVYVMGLYLPQKSQDAEGIIGSEGNKRITMHFVRDVGVEDIRKGWSKGFEKNYPEPASIQDEIDRFNASMRDVKAGEVIALDFADNAVSVIIGGDKVGVIEGKAFQKATLSIWLGPEPPNEALKDGVLGGSP